VNRKLRPARAHGYGYLLKLEAAVGAAKEAATTASTSRFVPVTLPAGRPKPAFHRAVAICPPAARRAPRFRTI